VQRARKRLSEPCPNGVEGGTGQQQTALPWTILTPFAACYRDDLGCASLTSPNEINREGFLGPIRRPEDAGRGWDDAVSCATRELCTGVGCAKAQATKALILCSMGDQYERKALANSCEDGRGACQVVAAARLRGRRGAGYSNSSPLDVPDAFSACCGEENDCTCRRRNNRNNKTKYEVVVPRYSMSMKELHTL
jgi:hypothetical protein